MADIDCIWTFRIHTPPVAAVSFVTSRRRRLVADLVPGAAGTAGLVPDLVPAELCRHPPLL